MLSSKCTHLRIRDTNDYDINVDNLIKSIEKEYEIDFRSLPGWENLVQRLHVSATDYKRKIQDSHLRKSIIIDKLFIQSSRPSPFELTAGLCRTARKWHQLEIEVKKPKISLMPAALDVVPDIKLEEPKQSETPHPNTEIASAESFVVELEPKPEPPKITDVEVHVESPVQTSHLPVTICTNHHKLISALGSQFSALSYKSILTETEGSVESEKEEWQRFKSTLLVKSIPMPITITNNTLKRQIVQFSVTNCTVEYIHIRFKRVLDYTPFVKIKILPVIPMRLYPGIAVIFKIIFKLKNQEEFKSGLYFRVGRDVYDEAPTEAFCIPFLSAFTKARSVTVSDTSMPPIYPWHIKRDSMYSTGHVTISVDDPYLYHLHIYKRIIDLSRESDIMLSLQASGPDTESVEERTEIDIKTIVSSAKGQNVQNEINSINVADLMALIAHDIVTLALESFIFESTYLYLQPYSKVKIPVYFTKAEHIGCHQSYYDFELVDPETEKVMMTKTIKIFAEVLPNPIQIQPLILDMSKSPVCHGYCQDNFVVTNSHKLYPVTIKIKLTTKMKKMFYVEPMEAVVPPLSYVPFAVKFCSRDFLAVHPSEDLVHFTFKIIVLGYKAVYENVPPFFYEVIAPCAVEFKKVYNEKYFKEI